MNVGCSLASPEAVKVCVDILFPWASMLLGLVGLGLVLWNLGATTVVAYILRSARGHEQAAENANKRFEEANQRYQDLAKIVSGPLTNYQNLIVESQSASARAERAERELMETQTRFEAFKAAPQANASEAHSALKQVEDKLTAIETRLASVRKSYEDVSTPFWSRPVGIRPELYEQQIQSSIPIIMFANQKGGVGKTTLSANLAAHFQHRGGERVLAVDLDYQGSMSNMLDLQSGAQEEGFRSTVDLLLQSDLPKDWRELAVKSLNKRFHYVPCYYSFEHVERKLEYSWLLGEEPDDIRYRLARVLLSPEIQNNFDRVIIDAPPRFTTGFVNGLCSSTHLFVPTIVDAPSLNAVGNFMAQFAKISRIVNPTLQLGGIIGIRTTNVQGHALPSTVQARADAADIAANQELGTSRPYFIRDAVIKNYPSLATAAEEGIPYFREETTREMFDNLGRRVAQLAPRIKR